MLRSLNSILVALLLLALGACSSVTTTHLLGEPIDAEQAARLEGAWVGGDSIFFVHHVGEGKTHVGTARWNDGEQKFTIEQDTVFVRAVGEAVILQIAEQREQESETRYSLTRLLITESGEIIYLAADADRFAAAIKRGELKGEAQGDGEVVEGFAATRSKNVHLTGAKAEIDAYLTPERLSLLFPVEASGVLRRIENVEIE